jgi:hypothetical protein
MCPASIDPRTHYGFPLLLTQLTQMKEGHVSVGLDTEI